MGDNFSKGFGKKRSVEQNFFKEIGQKNSYWCW